MSLVSKIHSESEHIMFERLLLEQCSIELFETKFLGYETSKQSTDSLYRFFASALLAPSTSTSVDILDTTAVGDILLDSMYYHFLSARNGSNPATATNFDFITEIEFDKRFSDYLTKPTDDNPVCIERMVNGERRFGFYPPSSASGDVWIYYLKRPKVPVYDYYISTNKKIVYLPEGALDHVWTTGEIDSSGNERTTGDPDYATTSIELDWEEQDKIRIIYLILQKVGVSIPDQLPLEYAVQKTQELNQA